MKDDYLWDKRGQPDPEIQELEEILGTLRYQPKPLALPVSRRRSYFPLLAIAASLLLALVAGGIWLRVRSRTAPQPQQAHVETPAKVGDENPKSAMPNPESIRDKSKTVVAVNKLRHRSVPSALTKSERVEALAAKEQLMLALRVTTEKLNLIHRKPLNTNQLKNQHRVG
jgi:hypothetical protein